MSDILEALKKQMKLVIEKHTFLLLEASKLTPSEQEEFGQYVARLNEEILFPALQPEHPKEIRLFRTLIKKATEAEETKPYGVV